MLDAKELHDLKEHTETGEVKSIFNLLSQVKMYKKYLKQFALSVLRNYTLTSRSPWRLLKQQGETNDIVTYLIQGTFLRAIEPIGLWAMLKLSQLLIMMFQVSPKCLQILQVPQPHTNADKVASDCYQLSKAIKHCSA